jgi:hypothetical protein
METDTTLPVSQRERERERERERDLKTEIFSVLPGYKNYTLKSN